MPGQVANRVLSQRKWEKAKVFKSLELRGTKRGDGANE